MTAAVMTYDASHRGYSQSSMPAGVCLQDKFEVMKEIGDGSFGSVSLARVRTAGAHVARRGTLVCEVFQFHVVVPAVHPLTKLDRSPSKR